MVAWSMWSRAADYSPDVVLPIASAQVVKRWLGFHTAVVQTEWSPERWLSLQPSRGLVIFRGERQEFTGLVTSRRQVWDAESGELRIRVAAASDEWRLANRLVFPDPGRAAWDQSVSDYWTHAGPASSAMWQLIWQQAGPGAVANGPIPGLAMGADPAVGASRTWSGRLASAGERGVLDQLREFSIASGVDLGVQVTTSPGELTFDVVEPRDVAGDVRFSADLRNLVGYEYEETAPTCTDALAAGQGDLKARLLRHATSSDPLSTVWGERIWKLIDRRDSDDVAELDQAAADAVTEGAAKVALSMTLAESDAARYGHEWGLGDRVTVYVAPPRHPDPIEVVDVVREVQLEVNEAGVETVTPAVGTHDAQVLPSDPQRARLAEVGLSLAGLVSRK